MVAAEAVAGGGRLRDGVSHLVGVGGENGGEHLAQGRLLGAGVQQVDVRLEGVHAEAVEECGGVQRVAEAAQAVELGEGADQFGLVVGVLVIAVRGGDGDAAALLVLVTRLRLGPVGVDLEGQRGAGGEQLEQERQAGPELGDRGGAELALRVGVDDLGEGAPSGARGAPGWAPIHISACGSPVGSVPSSRGMAVVEPQA